MARKRSTTELADLDFNDWVSLAATKLYVAELQARHYDLLRANVGQDGKEAQQTAGRIMEIEDQLANLQARPERPDFSVYPEVADEAAERDEPFTDPALDPKGGQQWMSIQQRR